MITAGIDEVGRGCWAGPLVAAAVILHKSIPGLQDSKILSRKQRQVLSDTIHKSAEVGIGWVSPREVDQLGLTIAVRTAMQRALSSITVEYDEIIIDGNYNFLPENERAKAVVKADASVAAVSAASIVAKVARDNYMINLGGPYRCWEFEKHVGYGTALHQRLLALHGVSDMHRKSYKPIQKIMGTYEYRNR